MIVFICILIILGFGITCYWLGWKDGKEEAKMDQMFQKMYKMVHDDAKKAKEKTNDSR